MSRKNKLKKQPKNLKVQPENAPNRLLAAAILLGGSAALILCAILAASFGEQNRTRRSRLGLFPHLPQCLPPSPTLLSKFELNTDSSIMDIPKKPTLANTLDLEEYSKQRKERKEKVAVRAEQAKFTMERHVFLYNSMECRNIPSAISNLLKYLTSNKNDYSAYTALGILRFKLAHEYELAKNYNEAITQLSFALKHFEIAEYKLIKQKGEKDESIMSYRCNSFLIKQALLPLHKKVNNHKQAEILQQQINKDAKIFPRECSFHLAFEQFALTQQGWEQTEQELNGFGGSKLIA